MSSGIGADSRMRIPFPTSRDVSGFRLGLFDIVWASVSPLAALYFSNAYVLSWPNNDGQIVALYCLISLLCSVVAFLFYRNGIIKETDVLDEKTLPKVEMPNRHGFVPDVPVYPPEPKPSWW